ncbi:prolyl oligopeptidase family serine peptidase [Qipengyuania sp. YG27]|uniref:Prolyl oligopeptidase family serine peptidase n=1 Tax=Qipengyuania mesophila TaxID=2867246 RepID=A0ABS7JRB4_9SPHN|nr:prolyl oligopeptidase family serine peptidase [Qipengyuania mesophila]MBX7500151.1 prolyl oligopeptidase family serine peptidase [Qipengyuania mesophila]
MSLFRSHCCQALACALSVVLAPAGLAAQDDPPPQIDAAGRPAKIPVAAFADWLVLDGARLSETGRRIAIGGNSDGHQMIRIYDADTLELKQVIDGGDSDDFNWFRWAGDDRLLLSVMRQTENANYWARMSRLLVYDMVTGKMSYAGLKKAAVDGDTVVYVDPAGEYVLLNYQNQARYEAEVWRVPLDGTAMERSERVVDNQGGVQFWFADSDGVVRLGMGRTSRGSVVVLYRGGPGEEFERVTKIARDDEDTIENWDVIGLQPGSDIGYTLQPTEDGREILREFNYRTATAGPVVYEDDKWSVEGVRLDDDGKPVAVNIRDDRLRQVWLDKDMGAVQDSLSQALGGRSVRIISNADRRRMLVLQTGPDDPGALYVFTPAEKRLAFLANLRPDIDFRLLSRGTAHDIATRDGLAMRSYLTLPRGRGKTGLPLIVMPHGGPFGIRDDLEYNDWVQLFANRGYAVLQPNFRGSGGFGSDFEEAGDGEIGRKMQDDLDDATRWAVAQGYADPARVCVVGASYGGYAALWAVIRNPELYRCAASWAGVTDWDAILLYDSEALTRRAYTEKWKPKVRGKDSGFDLSKVSPMAQLGRLTRPVFLGQGKDDTRVPYSQYYRLVEKAERMGIELDTLMLEDGHTPVREGNHEKLLDAMVAFLERHNPPD